MFVWFGLGVGERRKGVVRGEWGPFVWHRFMGSQGALANLAPYLVHCFTPSPKSKQKI